jgi:hypothetical protein
MAALGFWGWCRLVLTVLPELIDLVKRAAVFVDGQLDLIATRAAMKKLSSGLDKSKETGGDTSDVEGIFNPRNTAPAPDGSKLRN